jgi:hypothetical protein
MTSRVSQKGEELRYGILERRDDCDSLGSISQACVVVGSSEFFRLDPPGVWLWVGRALKARLLLKKGPLMGWMWRIRPDAS